MAFTRKSSAPVQRIEGEYPELPDGNELGLDGWWLDTRGVLNRVRDKIDDVAEAQTTTPVAPLTAAEIKALYETNSNTNNFTDSHLKSLESLSSYGDQPRENISKATRNPSSDRYLFTASTNQLQWIINHQLGFLPNVQIYNSALEEIEADIQHTDNYETIVNFTGTTTGYAVLS
jgi:hypothetical protein